MRLPAQSVALPALPTLLVMLVPLALATGEPPVPLLTPEQQMAIDAGRENSASFGDPAFDVLTNDTRGWGAQMMAMYAVDPHRRPEPDPLEHIMSVLVDPDAAAGEWRVILARFAERQPVPKYANWERWLVEPLDPDNPGKKADRAVIMFIDRTVSAIPTEPRAGWYVSAVVRFYKPLELPNRMTGELQDYPAFVGAVYDVRPRLGAALSSWFAIVGLIIAFMVAALVSLLVIVNKIRSKPNVTEAHAGPPATQAESDFPSDPAEALARLAQDTDPRHNDEHA